MISIHMTVNEALNLKASLKLTLDMTKGKPISSKLTEVRQICDDLYDRIEGELEANIHSSIAQRMQADAFDDENSEYL